ncbi:hypothetical protein CL622_08935 [archaeon]|nr:hypothetical protein [archaeon]
MSDNTEKPKIQCFCKWEKDDTDYKGMFKTTLEGTKYVAFIRSCHKCGKYRMALKVSDPKYETKSTDAPQAQAQQATQQQMF